LTLRRRGKIKNPNFKSFFFRQHVRQHVKSTERRFRLPCMRPRAAG
jgi:hypothetical protein